MAQEWAKSLYSSLAWHKCRDSFYISRNGLCERCGEAGLIVHHKVWLTPSNINDPSITLNWDNLELLCNECHSKEHLGSEATTEEVMFDSNGNLIKK